MRQAWETVIKAANDNYRPGLFTTSSPTSGPPCRMAAICTVTSFSMAITRRRRLRPTNPNVPKTSGPIWKAYGPAESMVAQAYADGVPMGANLDRIQVIKIWREGEHYQEQIFDVAVSGHRKIDPRSYRASTLGATVDLTTGSYSNTIGAASGGTSSGTGPSSCAFMTGSPGS